MFSLTVDTLKASSLSSNHPNSFLSSNFLTTHSLRLQHHHKKPPLCKPISATITPSPYPPNPPPQQQLYQPFRPPPSPLPPKFCSLDIPARIEILSNRLGPWFEYATLIPSLSQEGFSPSTIEELTGIAGVEQNRLIVATHVRDSLIQSNTDPDVLSFFDTGGAELLYEIRLLSTSQRAAAARFLVENKFDAKGARDVARAMKDFPSRRGDKGWESFNYTLPADCLSFMYYRQAQEHKNPSDQRTAALQQALEVAESEEAKKRVMEDLEGKANKEEKDELESRVIVPVVRMRMGEVAEASNVVVLPVCRAAERGREVVEAPWECATAGEFGVVEAEKGWNRWVVLPGWGPIAGLKRGGVVVAFPDARVLPWKANRWNKEEAILVVADRDQKEVGVDEGVYLVAADNDEGGLKVQRGLALRQMGVEECLGTVVLVVRPPREEEDDQLSDEDWD